jgi:hypothetical protein
LELGKTLVSELKLEESRDTLARWLAHHVAELISDAEKAGTARVRKEAANQAVETILKIWSHRANLPGNADPLAPYRNLAQILEALNPRSGDWMRPPKSPSLIGLYRRFPRLMLALLMRELPQTRRGGQAARKLVHKFLDTEERRLLAVFEARLQILGHTAETTHPKDEHARLQELTNKLIDETVADLEALRKGPAGGA